MGSVYQARQTIVWVDIDRNHQIQPQECQVREVILRQPFTTQMCMDKAETSKAIYRYADALEIRQLNTAIVSDNYILNMPTAID
jgi:hypothetical protein